MKNEQTQTRTFVQAKLNEFSKNISCGFSRPVQKFIKDMLFGVCGTGNPSVHNIAKMIQDETSTKKTSERLYRNLQRKDLDQDLEMALLNVAKSQIKKDTLLIVDESDIEKPYAKKMEGCQLVHNGSKSERSNGYLLVNTMALTVSGEDYRLLPINSSLVAPNMEQDSVKQLLQDKIIEQQVAFNGKGIYVFDRGYDDRKLLGFLRNNDISFVIRGVGLRAVKEGLLETNFKKVVADMDFSYDLPGFKKGHRFHCATRRIAVRTDDHPSKKSNSVELSVVVVRKYIRNTQRGKDFYLLCDFSNRNLSEQEIIEKAIDVYRKRWSIEEVHRQMKQDLKWESMRLASYQGLKNLNMLMNIALYFIYKCKDYIHILTTGFTKLICFSKNDKTKLKQFSYYRIAEVISLCLSVVRTYDTSPYKQELRDRWQLKIRLV